MFCVQGCSSTFMEAFRGGTGAVHAHCGVVSLQLRCRTQQQEEALILFGSHLLFYYILLISIYLLYKYAIDLLSDGENVLRLGWILWIFRRSVCETCGLVMLTVSISSQIPRRCGCACFGLTLCVAFTEAVSSLVSLTCVQRPHLASKNKKRKQRFGFSEVLRLQWKDVEGPT